MRLSSLGASKQVIELLLVFSRVINRLSARGPRSQILLRWACLRFRDVGGNAPSRRAWGNEALTKGDAEEAQLRQERITQFSLRESRSSGISVPRLCAQSLCQLLLNSGSIALGSSVSGYPNGRMQAQRGNCGQPQTKLHKRNGDG
jgi:hypothetical protein